MIEIPSIETLRGKSIGLLGGSFNPAHGGHLHISQFAINLLNLDSVWWLVSPQNPLKSSVDMAPFSERLQKAKKVTSSTSIVVTGIEDDFLSQYTIDTLQTIQKRFKQVRFVWLMGADNLLQIDQWKDWKKIFSTMPIAVFDRHPYSEKVEESIAVKKFKKKRMSSLDANKIAYMKAPAWVYLRIPLNLSSGTKIRSVQKVWNKAEKLSKGDAK